MNINNNIANTTASIPASTVTITRAPVLRLRARAVDTGAPVLKLRAHAVYDSEAGSSTMHANLGNSSRSVGISPTDSRPFLRKKRPNEDSIFDNVDNTRAKKSTATSTFSHINENSTADRLRNAIRNNDLTTVKALIAGHANKNYSDENGNTLLHILADIDNVDIDESIINELISSNLDADKCNNNEETPLVLAIKNNQLEIVKALIKKGANVNKPDSKKNTPLHLAAEQSNENIVNAILTQEIFINSKNIYDQTSLHIAVSKNSIPVVKH